MVIPVDFDKTNTPVNYSRHVVNFGSDDVSNGCIPQAVVSDAGLMQPHAYYGSSPIAQFGFMRAVPLYEPPSPCWVYSTNSVCEEAASLVPPISSLNAAIPFEFTRNGVDSVKRRRISLDNQWRPSVEPPQQQWNNYASSLPLAPTSSAIVRDMVMPFRGRWTIPSPTCALTPEMMPCNSNATPSVNSAFVNEESNLQMPNYYKQRLEECGNVVERQTYSLDDDVRLSYRASTEQMMVAEPTNDFSDGRTMTPSSPNNLYGCRGAHRRSNSSSKLLTAFASPLMQMHLKSKKGAMKANTGEANSMVSSCHSASSKGTAPGCDSSTASTPPLSAKKLDVNDLMAANSQLLKQLLHRQQRESNHLEASLLRTKTEVAQYTRQQDWKIHPQREDTSPVAKKPGEACSSSSSSPRSQSSPTLSGSEEHSKRKSGASPFKTLSAVHSMRKLRVEYDCPLESTKRDMEGEDQASLCSSRSSQMSLQISKVLWTDFESCCDDDITRNRQELEGYHSIDIANRRNRGNSCDGVRQTDAVNPPAVSMGDPRHAMVHPHPEFDDVDDEWHD